ADNDGVEDAQRGSTVPVTRTTSSGDPKTKTGHATAAAAAATKRRVLKAEDLVYKGSFAPPKSVQGISTSYTLLGLAMPVVAGKRRFFAGAGPYDAGVYEMNFPGLSRAGEKKSCPNAIVLKWWG